MKILVIEDDTAISELICMNLEAAGYETQAIFDGNEAAELLKTEESGSAALALVDVMLPGKDGFELMEDLQSAQIPVIYLTAKDDVISKVHGLKAGAEDYIVKPFEVLELLVTLAQSKNVAFSREELLSRLWGVDYVGETRTVDVHIGQLRKKLDFHDVIRTVSKMGYRLEDMDHEVMD